MTMPLTIRWPFGRQTDGRGANAATTTTTLGENEKESESQSLSWQRKLCVKMALKGICADNG